MKRFLLVCGLAAIFAVPAASAAVTLTPSCTSCVVGQSVSVAGSGFNDNASYFWTVASVNNGTQGTFAPVVTAGGALSFSFAPWAADQYEVRVWIKNGRNLKVVSDIWITAA